MRFCDNNGRIFSMKSYLDYPIGYEYEQTPYIFWIDNEYSYKLSVNNYYILPVRVLVDRTQKRTLSSLNISIESNVFSLLKCSDISNYDSNNDAFIYEDQFTNEIDSISDVNVIESLSGKVYRSVEIPVTNDGTQTIEYDTTETTESFDLVTFYVIGTTKEEGSWMTNILIKLIYNMTLPSGKTIETEEYCPITIGGTFVDEIEQLQINARNIGVKLPKDIIKAVYQFPYSTDIIDETSYNTKLKEYLIHHMTLKSECGNYNSVLTAIKWFGWENQLDVIKHLKTDNELIEQFINDSFNIEEDIIDAFKYFKTSTYMSLAIPSNRDTDIYDSLNWNNDFVGEHKPIKEDLFDKEISEKIGQISFTRSYYDFTFKEIGLKLSCLAYMLKKYFLPIHLSIKSASIKEHVYANDIKLLNKAKITLTEEPVFSSIDLATNKTVVEFDNATEFFLYNDSIYVDDNYNLFSHYTKEYCETTDDNFIYSNDSLCCKIPISFSCTDTSKDCVYNTVLCLTKYGESSPIITTNFTFSSNEHYAYFVIIPEMFSSHQEVNFWKDSMFTLDIMCNGIWYSKEFTIRVPELTVSYGKLKYQYSDEFRQIDSMSASDSTVKFLYNMYDTMLVTTHNASFANEVTRAANLNQMSYYINLLSQEVKISDSKKYYNKIVIYNITDSRNRPLIYKESTLYSMYSKFFNNDGSQKNIDYRIGNNEFDFYLMRNDENRYYGVFISKDTIDNIDFSKKKTLVVPEGYKFEFFREDEVFLVNRMVISTSKVIDNDGQYTGENNHHFVSDDIIIATVENSNLPFILSLGARWEFKKLSFGGESIPTVTSKTNTAIISIPKENSKYAKGYYEVVVNYSIDNYSKETEIIKSKIRID